MTQREKLLAKILAGTSDQSISFDALVSLLQELGFEMRVRGSHHIFTHAGVGEILNLQPRPDRTAKPYQVKQIRTVLSRYGLTGDDHGIR
jgi:predicted RNA binding protein YcfA (HicA-like mRNA interferase family)